MSSTALVTITQETKQLAKKMDNFQTLTLPLREQLYLLLQSGFDRPGDIMIYQKQPWITKQGWWRAVGRSSRRIARVEVRPVPMEERVMWGLTKDQVGFISDLFLEGDAKPFVTGFGTASATMPHGSAHGKGNPVERVYPARMGMKRSEADAIKKAALALDQAPAEDIGTYDPQDGPLDEPVAITVEDALPPEGATREAPGDGFEQRDTAPPIADETPEAAQGEAPSKGQATPHQWTQIARLYGFADSPKGQSQFMYLYCDDRAPDTLTELEAHDFIVAATQ